MPAFAATGDKIFPRSERGGARRQPVAPGPHTRLEEGMAGKLGAGSLALSLALAVMAVVPSRPASADATASTDFTVASSLDSAALKARYYRPAAAGTYPVVMIPHGGGGDVNSEAPRAQAYAAIGCVGVVWSARGHGAPPNDSGGLFDLFGPKTIQDARDVLDYVLSHASTTGADPNHVGITGYSQGGGTTNLVAAKDSRIKATAPGHTFSGLIESLKPNSCLKLSVDGVILGAAYLANKARPDPDLISRWTTYLGSGVEIPNASTGKVPSQELEERSPRNFVATETQPTYWIQAFDDPLFPVDQALLMYHSLPGTPRHLYLSWGGHFQPQPPSYETTYREEQMHRWMSAFLKGSDDGIGAAPPVTYWYLAADRTNIVRRETTAWPPPNVSYRTVPLDPGRAFNAGGAQGTAEDPAFRFGLTTVGIGAVSPQLPSHTALDTIVTDLGSVSQDTIYAGSAHADVRWTSTGSPSQVIVKVWDVAPNGAATMLGRGCTMAAGLAGTEQRVQLDLWHSAVEVPAGHHLQAWVQAADAPLWEPPAPGTGTVSAGSTITLPLLGGGFTPRVTAAPGNGLPNTGGSATGSPARTAATGLGLGSAAIVAAVIIGRRRRLRSRAPL